MGDHERVPATLARASSAAGARPTPEEPARPGRARRWRTGCRRPRAGRPRPDRCAEVRCARAVLRASGAFDEDGLRRGAGQPGRAARHRPADPVRHRRDGASSGRPAWTSTCGGTGASTSTRRARTSTRCCTTCWPAGRPATSRPATGARRASTPGWRRAGRHGGSACSRPTTATAWSTSTSWTYLRELGRHADVYYLADGVLEPGELTSSTAIVRGAWSIPHGRYDFGSYSLLARDLVGWETVGDLRRAAPGQRQLLPAAPARRHVRRDGHPRVRLVGPAGDLDGVQRGRRRRPRGADADGRGQGRR